MFDLFRSREKSVRILLGALLVVVAFSMLTYLVPNYDTGGRAGDTVIAQVGKDTIALQDVQRAIQNTMRGRQIPPEVLPTFIPQIVDNMISERAMLYEADRQGFQVSDAELAQSIQAMVPSLFPEGKFVGREAYAGVLAQQGMSIQEFERELKRSLLITRLRDMALEGIVVSPAEIEQEFRKRNEKSKVEYVKVTADRFRGEVQVTDDELHKAYNANLIRYQRPEKKSLAILVADPAKLEQNIAVPDADLQRYYNQNKETFRVQERVKVRHILLKTTEKGADDAKIKAKAEDLLKQIKAGGNFAELAKKNSEDTGSAQTGGELPDWVTRGQMVPEFEKAAFTMNPGQTSDLVKTQYGYHIVQTLQKEQARLRTFDEVKTEIASQLKKQRASDQMDQISSRAQDLLRKDPTHPETVAAQIGMQVVRATDVSAGDPLPEIGVAKDLEDSVAQLKVGEVSQMVALPGNKTALAVVTGVQPARPLTFEESKATVREAVTREKLVGVVAAKANQLADKAKAMGGDLTAAAKSMGLEVKTSDEFTRQGAVEGLGSANYVQDAFVKPVGAILGPLGIEDGKVLVKVLAHGAPDMSQLESQRAGLRDEIKARKGRDRTSLFEAGLREALIKQGKIKIHQDVLNRLTQSYRG